jgi:hypothetical protein
MVELTKKTQDRALLGLEWLDEFRVFRHQADGETKQALVERRFTRHGGVTMRYDRGDRRVTVERSLDQVGVEVTSTRIRVSKR